MNQEIQLTRLKPGQTAAVKALTAQGSMRRRLQDIGLIEGTLVECVGVSPLGDPSAYLIRGAVIALRSKDAACVAIRDISGPKESDAPAARPALHSTKRLLTRQGTGRGSIPAQSGGCGTGGRHGAF